MSKDEQSLLKEKYSQLSDEEIIELIGCGKNNLDQEVYTIVLSEFKKRSLKDLISETKQLEQLRKQSANETLVTIARFNRDSQAHIVRALLISHDIETFVADEHLISVNWLYANAIGGVKVQVKTSEVQKAREILAQKPDLQFREVIDKVNTNQLCPKCHHDNIVYEKYNRKVYFLSWLLLGIPLPFLKKTWKCQDCNHQWKY